MGATDPRLARREMEQKRLAEWCAKRSHAVALTGVQGSPPSRYTLRFDCISMASLSDAGVPRMTGSQSIDILLPSNYPMAQPQVMITTKVVHPNIWTSGQVCLGHYWSSQRTLDQLADQLWRILVWDPEVTDPNSAANGLAASWYRNTFDGKPFDRVDPAAPRPEPEPEPEKAAEPEKPRIVWT